MGGFPDEESLSLLSRLRVGYVLVDSSQYADAADLDRRIRAAGLIYAETFESVGVFLIP